MPILSLQCINTISAFSLANFSTSLAALPAIRCHSGTLFRFSWSCGKRIVKTTIADVRILPHWALCSLCRCKCLWSDTVAIFKLSRMCILSTSFSGTESGLSRYASRPVGWEHTRQSEWVKTWTGCLSCQHWLPSWSSLPVAPSLH